MSYDVIVKIIADGKKAVAEFDKAGRSAERMARKTDDAAKQAKISMDKIGRQAGIAGAAMIGAAGTVAFAMKGWVNSAQEAERAHLQLESSVRGAYGASSKAVGAFEAQAKAIQKVTVASDEDVSSIQAMLVQFGLTQRQVSTLTPLVVDIARKWNIDYVSAAKAVMKSADGKTTALKKLGIQVDDTKAKTDPYIATVDALRKAAGGFAEQEGKTFAGQTAILSNQMDELKESLGRGVLSVLTKMLPAVNDVAGAFTNLDDKTGGLVGSTAAVGTGVSAVLGALALAVSAAIKTRSAYQEAADGTGTFAAVAGSLPGIGLAIAGAFGTQALIRWAAGVDKATSSADKFTAVASGPKGAVESFNMQFEASQRRQAASFSGFFKGIYSMILRAPAPTLPDNWGGAFQRQGRELGKRIQDGIAREGYNNAFNKALALNPQNARDLIQYAETHDKLRAKIEASGASIKKWRQALNDSADLNKDGVVAGLEKVQFRADSIKDVQTYIDAVNGATDAQTGYVKATLSAKDAQGNLVEAEKNLAEARKENDPTKIQDAQGKVALAYLAVADANRQVQDAAIKQAEAQLDLQNLIADHKKFQESIDHWQELANAMGSDSPIAAAIRQRIDDWVLMAYTTGQELTLNDPAILESLARLHDQGKITTDQLADLNQEWTAGQLETSGVDTPLDKLIAKFTNFAAAWTQFWADVPGTGSSGPINPYIPPAYNALPPRPTVYGSHARATGGPVAAGTPYLVGEQGPELFVPTGNGMIVPNSQLGSGSAVATGGIVVNVSSSVLSTPAETGAAVVDALTAWSRRNGRLPNALVA
jgi:hypothetical protein